MILEINSINVINSIKKRANVQIVTMKVRCISSTNKAFVLKDLKK